METVPVTRRSTQTPLTAIGPLQLTSGIEGYLQNIDVESWRNVPLPVCEAITGIVHSFDLVKKFSLLLENKNTNLSYIVSTNGASCKDQLAYSIDDFDKRMTQIEKTMSVSIQNLENQLTTSFTKREKQQFNLIQGQLKDISERIDSNFQMLKVWSSKMTDDKIVISDKKSVKRTQESFYVPNFIGPQNSKYKTFQEFVERQVGLNENFREKLESQNSRLTTGDKDINCVRNMVDEIKSIMRTVDLETQERFHEAYRETQNKLTTLKGELTIQQDRKIDQLSLTKDKQQLLCDLLIEWPKVNDLTSKLERQTIQHMNELKNIASILDRKVSVDELQSFKIQSRPTNYVPFTNDDMNEVYEKIASRERSKQTSPRAQPVKQVFQQDAQNAHTVESEEKESQQESLQQCKKQNRKRLVPLQCARGESASGEKSGPSFDGNDISPQLPDVRIQTKLSLKKKKSRSMSGTIKGDKGQDERQKTIMKELSRVKNEFKKKKQNQKKGNTDELLIEEQESRPRTKRQNLSIIETKIMPEFDYLAERLSRLEKQVTKIDSQKSFSPNQTGKSARSISDKRMLHLKIQTGRATLNETLTHQQYNSQRNSIDGSSSVWKQFQTKPLKWDEDRKEWITNLPSPKYQSTTALLQKRSQTRVKTNFMKEQMQFQNDYEHFDISKAADHSKLQIAAKSVRLPPRYEIQSKNIQQIFNEDNVQKASLGNKLSQNSKDQARNELLQKRLIKNSENLHNLYRKLPERPLTSTQQIKKQFSMPGQQSLTVERHNQSHKLVIGVNEQVK